MVVLHVHPFDVTRPIMAFSAWPDRPPTILMNHADHAFWLGVSCSDVVATIRPAAAALATERRGVDPDRVVELPIPAPFAVGRP